ncbi:MAG TPA: outer membrane beta-barrel protein [Acidobacteriaceae bacterium]|nr:outer membrane beta-barrel protein [Acidobacteriaceae bacterium]
MLKTLLTIGTLAAAALSFSATGHAQALPTATAAGALQAGIGWSYALPDYGTDKIQGITAFADFDFAAKVGVEAEYHYISLITPADLGENSVLVGPRYIIPRGRYSLYAKALVGIGDIAIQEVQDNPQGGAGTYLAYGAGGGIDYRIGRHLVARGDFEYQHWSYRNGLTPMVITGGIAYRFR